MSFARAIGRAEARALTALRLLLGLGLCAMVIVNVANAAGRYGGLPTLTGADELLVFTMIYIVMIGAILAARARTHLAIDLLPQRLPPRAQRGLGILLNLLAALVCGFIAVQSLDFVERIGALGQTSIGLGVPMVVPHAAIPIGFFGIAAVSLFLTIADIAALAGGRDE